jgi:hypothetical protein
MGTAIVAREQAVASAQGDCPHRPLNVGARVPVMLKML